MYLHVFFLSFLQMYAYYVLRGDMLSHLEVHLKDAVVKMQSDPTDWRYLEAVLHAYSSVAETVAETDNFYVPRFIQSIPQIPFSDNIQLISVALTTLGWLPMHFKIIFFTNLCLYVLNRFMHIWLWIDFHFH